MSFSSDVKDELTRQVSHARHCQIAEIAAIICFSGKIARDEAGNYSIFIQTENGAIARKYFTLIKKTFNISIEFSVKQHTQLKKGNWYEIQITRAQDALKILRTLKLIDENNDLIEDIVLVNGMVVQRLCCKRAFVRGAFISSGSISDPEKNYHFEIVCSSENEAEKLVEIIDAFDIESKVVLRKKHYVVYIKEASLIVDMLNVMGAHVSLMNLENIRILKDMRNSVNRVVNCETANINKTVNAAYKQIEDIKLIEERKGLDYLSKSLSQIAYARLENPDASLKELGELLDPPVGKSGVNHRLRKLSEIAEDIRTGGNI